MDAYQQRMAGVYQKQQKMEKQLDMLSGKYANAADEGEKVELMALVTKQAGNQ